jgi:hypothetical protein
MVQLCLPETSSPRMLVDGGTARALLVTTGRFEQTCRDQRTRIAFRTEHGGPTLLPE